MKGEFMLQEFFETVLSLTKKDKKRLEYLLYKYFWENKEMYDFFSNHTKFFTFSQRIEISKKIKEIGDILDGKS